MGSIQCRIAETRREIDDALRVRWAVFGEELDLLAARPPAPREVDAFDTLETTLHFVAYDEGLPIATARLLLPSPEVALARGGRLGLDLETKFDLRELCAPGLALAETTRVCILAPYRSSGAADALGAAMRRESLERGVTHWVAAANAETDAPEDALLILDVAAR
jgi:putative hemolysin